MLKDRLFYKIICFAMAFTLLPWNVVTGYAASEKNERVLAEVVFSNTLSAKGATVLNGDGETPLSVSCVQKFKFGCIGNIKLLRCIRFRYRYVLPIIFWIFQR